MDASSNDVLFLVPCRVSNVIRIQFPANKWNLRNFIRSLACWRGFSTCICRGRTAKRSTNVQLEKTKTAETDKKIEPE